MDTNITLKFRSFESQILYFNGMYKLPVAAYPTINIVANDVRVRCSPHLFTNPSAAIFRLSELKKILEDEVAEVDDIIGKLQAQHDNLTADIYSSIDLLTDLADWLGDIQVYCASEMAKFGIPLQETLSIIMQSNFSKLDSDGQVIMKGGKVQKGPFYWKPEPQIKEMLLTKIEENKK